MLYEYTHVLLMLAAVLWFVSLYFTEEKNILLTDKAYTFWYYFCYYPQKMYECL